MISVIITTFNRISYARRAISSVLSQSYQNFELLILDNNSNDGTELMVLEFNDNRIKYFKHCNLSISDQRNLGISLSKYDYISFLDDDDYWPQNKLLDQYSAFMNSTLPNLALVYGSYTNIDNQNLFLSYIQPKKSSDYLNSLLSFEYFFTGSASNPMMLKSAVIDCGKFSNKAKVGEDWELYINLSLKYNFLLIEPNCVFIRNHSGNRLGNNMRASIRTDIYIYKKYLKKMNTKSRNWLKTKISGKLIRLGKKNIARKIIIQEIFNNKNYYSLSLFIMLMMSFFNKNTYLLIHNFYVNKILYKKMGSK